jgi:5'-nucleotidase/UDP-sugar diphosphatase
MLRRLLLSFLLALPVSRAVTAEPVTVTMFHVSDYHSSALPFYTEEGERGGIARAIGFLREQKRRGALVFSGGDTMNAGAPAWSDKYQCIEWPWWNGVFSAMALGNHEPDYGFERFNRCRKGVHYPILSANTKGFPASIIVESRGVRIGVFAVAGPDFPQLVKVPELRFDDSVAAARTAVRSLREEAKVDVVVMIGHEHQAADYELARAVPGIDVIFGSHSHLRQELTKIPGTATWFISPFQYLTYISRVDVTVDHHEVQRVEGALITVDGSMTEDRKIAARVSRLQKQLERDPQYRELFVPIGRLPEPLSVEALAALTLRTMRESTQADVALSTSSSFRRPLAAGTLTMELLRGALPYDNEIVTCSMPGAQLQQLLDTVKETYVDGAPPVDAARTYRVATTNYVAFVAYTNVFQCQTTSTGLHVRDEVRKKLAKANGTQAP